MVRGKREKRRASLSNTRKASLVGGGEGRSETEWEMKQKEKDNFGTGFSEDVLAAQVHRGALVRCDSLSVVWRLCQTHNMYPVFFNGKGSTQKPFRCSHMKPLLPALSSQLRRRFFRTETSNNCRPGNNLTTALLSQSSLVRLEF